MAIWRYASKALKSHIPLYPAILLLGIYSNVIMRDKYIYEQKDSLECFL